MPEPDPGHETGPGRRRARNQRGEGVISTAIAVLIVALLGVALWSGFQVIVQDATDRTSHEIQQISGAP